jgi:hypothetical protein
MPNEFKVKNGLIVDQGGANITGSSAISGALAINSSGSNVFTVDGTSGRLFSVDDSLSGSLFSVNTAAGLPVMEAFSDNTVRIGQYGKQVLFVSQSKVGVGKESTLNGILDVSGSVSITGSMSVSSGITGSLFGSASYAFTASYALNAGGASIDTGSFATTGSNRFIGNQTVTGSLTLSSSAEVELTVIGNQINTGSITATQGFTGSLFGTASWANNASTASYAANGGVTQLLAGSNITLSPTNGLGQVTINSTGGGGSSFNTATGSYGSFYSTQTQTNVAGTARSMSLNITDISNGVSISGSTDPFNTYIKIQSAGIYNIQFSAQVDKTDAGTDEMWIWVRKNGTNLTDTATSLQLDGNGAHYVAAWNFFVNAAAGDYFQLMWYSPDANVRLHAEPAFGVVPGIPSLIVTANRIDQFLSNTGSFSGSFNGSLFGTASWAQNAITASYVTSSGVYGPNGSNSILSSSFALTASYVLNALSASFAATAALAPNYVLNSSTGSFVTNNQTGSFVTNAQTSSFVTNSQTSSFVLNSQTSSMTVATASFATSSLSASFASTASFAPLYVLNSQTSSFVQNSQTSSFVTNSQTGSFITNSQTSSMSVASASQAATASSADNFTVRGTLTAQTIVAQTITSSTDFVTGSTRFGSLSTNTHQFTGSVSITGSLTLSYLSTGSVLFAGATDNIAEDNTNFFWDNTNKRLGIGTNVPAGRLDIRRTDVGSQSSLYLINSSTTGTNNIMLGEDISTKNLGFGWYGSGAAQYRSLSPSTAYMYVLGGGSQLSFNTTTTSQPITFATNDWTERMRIFGGGNISIGGGNTPSDTGERLQVSGSTKLLGNTVITGSLIVTQGITGSLFGTASWAQNAITASYISASNIAGLSLSQISLGAVTASITAGSNIFNIISGSNTLVVVDNTGSVGIGTTSPGYKLDVNGTARVSGEANIQGLTAGTGNNSPLGNLNTAFGYQAGFSNTSTPGAYANSFFGNIAGRLVSTGYGNSFFGYSAGVTITTGTYNTAIGMGAMYSAPSNVGNNVALGYSSLGQCTGSNNTCIGSDSGRVAGSSNVYIGYNSGYLTANGSNNIAIGMQSGQYTGDNKLYIAGNPNAYGNLIYGDFSTGQLKINNSNTPSLNASAQFEVVSTTRGFLPPRMTAAQRIAISSPAQGLLVYDTGSITEGLWLYNSGSTPGWQEVLTNTGSQSILGGLTATSFTGSLQGTSSWANNAITASYISASNIAGLSLSQISLGLVTASVNTGTNIFNIISGSNTLVVVDNTGSVGIGTTSPGYKLDVNGTARVSGYSTLGGIINTGEFFGPTNTYFNGPIINTGTFNLRYANASLPATIATTLSTQALTVGSNNTVASISGPGVTRFAIGNTAATSSWIFENYRNAAVGSLEFTTDASTPFITYFTSRSLAIGSFTETPSALLAMTSTTRGFLPPRLTTTQKNAIATPAQGLHVYDIDTSTEGIWYYSSGSIKAWTRVLNDTGSQSITGSLTVTQGITGSLFGTSSWATNVVNAPNPFPYTGSAIITGSIVITGSAYGNVPAITVASNTASFDIRSGNFFTVTMGASSTTHFNVTNPSPGQTVSILVRTNTASTASFSSNVRQVTGSLYTPSVSGSNDILTFITFDSTNVFMTSLKRLA